MVGELRVDGRGVPQFGSAAKVAQACIKVIYLVLEGGDVIAHLIELAMPQSVSYPSDLLRAGVYTR